MSLSRKTNLLMTLTSPSFSVNYPAIENKAAIPEDCLQAMEVSWLQEIFPEGEINFWSLQDVYVAKEGLLFDESLEVFPASITQHSDGEVAEARDNLEQRLSAGNIPRLEGSSILCKKRGVHNYGHWLVEMMPKALLAHRHISFPYRRYIGAKTEPNLASVMVNSTAILDSRTSLMMLDDDPVRLESVIFIDGLSYHGVYLSPVAISCIEHLAAGIPGRGSKRLFVNRSSGGRQFMDSEILLSCARQLGYTIINPERMTLSEQIACFRDADVVAGPVGAGMTNIAFTKPGAVVINFVPATMPDTFFWFISTHKRHEYREVRCEQVGDVQGYAPWDNSMAIDPQAFQELLSV